MVTFTMNGREIKADKENYIAMCKRKRYIYSYFML